MAKSRQALRARVSQATGRQRKKPTNGVERAVDDLKQLVSDMGDRLFAAKKTAADRKRSGRQRQAEAKKAGASRIRSGRQRQAAAKTAARKRGLKTS